MISFRSDAPEYTPREAAERLCSITERYPFSADSYSLGGFVEKLEKEAAVLLGKERAVFMPTGTLANHLAVRALMGNKKRVLLQEQGHLYNDCGDCLSVLSGFTPVPLGKGRASYTLKEAEEAFNSAESGKVACGVGALVIETPVRRRHGEVFDFEEIERICSWAKGKAIGRHLDGARLFIASAYSGISPAAYASHFDTVYVSLYKYLNSPSGAILAGSEELMKDLYHERRMFGGGLNQSWILTAFALEALPGFHESFSRAVETGEELKKHLLASGRFLLEEIPRGTNIFILSLTEGRDPGEFIKNLAKQGILLPAPEKGRFFLRINLSILEKEPVELAEIFLRSV